MSQDLKNRKSISLVLPCYNEEKSIPLLLSDLIKLKTKIHNQGNEMEIIIVNDGSTDGTAEILKSFSEIKSLHNLYNLGNGSSVKRGILEAKNDYIILMDSDGQHKAHHIEKLIEEIGEYDMIVGSRTSQCNTSAFRDIGNFFLKKIASILVGKKIPDLTSGLRMMKREMVMDFLHLFPRKYSYPTTITLSTILSSKFIKFYAFDDIDKRSLGKSHIRPYIDGIKFITIMLRMMMLFNPNRIFLPISFILFCLGSGLIIYQIFGTDAIRGGSILLLMSSIFIFFFGLLADQIASLRREKRYD